MASESNDQNDSEQLPDLEKLAKQWHQRLKDPVMREVGYPMPPVEIEPIQSVNGEFIIGAARISGGCKAEEVEYRGDGGKPFCAPVRRCE